MSQKGRDFLHQKIKDAIIYAAKEFDMQYSEAMSILDYIKLELFLTSKGLTKNEF